MGACDVWASGTGTSASKVFAELCEDARYEYGNDYYSGSIATTSLRSGAFKTYQKYTKTNEKAAYKLAEKALDGLCKRQCGWIDLGVVEWRVTTVKKVANKDFGPTYKLCWAVRQKDPDKVLKTFSTKTEADKWAFSQITSGKYEAWKLTVTKEYVNTSNSSNTATIFVTETKTYKSKPSLKEMPNRKVEAIHKYIFFGWASC